MRHHSPSHHRPHGHTRRQRLPHHGYVHIAHDVQWEITILANACNVAGHVVIEDQVIIEGMVASSNLCASENTPSLREGRWSARTFRRTSKPRVSR